MASLFCLAEISLPSEKICIKIKYPVFSINEILDNAWWVLCFLMLNHANSGGHKSFILIRDPCLHEFMYISSNHDHSNYKSTMQFAMLMNHITFGTAIMN